ncbi:hypothetical protein D3P04_13595 [Paracoccus onubensis]|uniref:Uncharacterized protein n=1 Tax=Paracoccus onubensis TaxID=1675788 RepID=A0A418SSY8_9RHOB|nr:hypothetical protein D3P04_13595 [Paracoccus onubensis]
MKWIEVKCEMCNRHGRYRRDRFYEIAGTDHSPSALTKFAAEMGCEKAIEQWRQFHRYNNLIMHDRCEIQYYRPDL